MSASLIVVLGILAAGGGALTFLLASLVRRAKGVRDAAGRAREQMEPLIEEIRRGSVEAGRRARRLSALSGESGDDRIRDEKR